MKNAAERINELHNGMVRNTVETASKIGKLLTEQKDICGHGNFEKWCYENLDFSKATVTRYMNIFEWCHKNEDVNLKNIKLSELYKEIEKGKKKKRTNEDHRNNDNMREAIRELYAERKHSFQNPPKGKVLNEIINGDTLEVLRQMKANSIHLICTSVPYNNNLFYGPNCNDNKPYQEYLGWLGEFVSECYRVLVKGGRLVINCDNMTNKERDEDGEFTYRHSLDCDLRYKVRELGLGLLEYQDIIWYKFNNGGAKIKCWGSFASPSQPNFRNCKEHFLIWAKDEYKLPQPNGVETDITEKNFEEWTYNVWKLHPNTNKNCPHPCTWPERLTERFVQLFSFPEQIVLDPFCGSGTTCVSANKLGRKFIGIDQNPNYCQWAKDRINGKDMTKELAHFLLSVKSELETKLSAELVNEKLGRYFRMVKPKTKKAAPEKGCKNVKLPVTNNSKKKSA